MQGDIDRALTAVASSRGPQVGSIIGGCALAAALRTYAVRCVAAPACSAAMDAASLKSCKALQHLSVASAARACPVRASVVCLRPDRGAGAGLKARAAAGGGEALARQKLAQPVERIERFPGGELIGVDGSQGGTDLIGRCGGCKQRELCLPATRG